MEKLNKLTQTVQIDVRLFCKKEINSNQKNILAYIMGYLVNNDKFYATNAHISKATGISKKTISNSVTLFFNMGFFSIITSPSNHRHIYLTEDNIIKYNDWLGTLEDHQNMMEMKKERKPETPTKPAVKAKKEVPQPVQEKEVEAPENDITVEQQPTPKQDRFDELFPEDEDEEPITIKSIDRDKIKEAEALEKAEEMEVQKYVEDYQKEMNNVNADERCLINIINSEDDKQMYFEKDQLQDIIEQYNDQLTTNLKDTTIFINVVKQLIKKDKIDKIQGEDFSTYLVLTNQKELANVTG